MQRLTSLAKELLALAQEFDPEEGYECDLDSQKPGAIASGGAADLEHVLRQLYHQRRRRREFFDSKLFGEPAWDFLLGLYIAGRQQKRVSVTSARIAADVPSTTALRWIGLLEKEGLVVRENDEADARRVFIRLTSDGDAHEPVSRHGSPAPELYGPGRIAPGRSIFSGHVPSWVLFAVSRCFR